MKPRCKICRNPHNKNLFPFSFCSVECKREHERRLLEFKPKSNCVICEKEFVKRLKTAVACSLKCRKAYAKVKYNESKVSIVSLFTIYMRDNFRCIYCGKSSIEDEVKLHMDHAVPLSKGGRNTISNIITSCEACNLSKYNKELNQSDLKRVLGIIKSRNDVLEKDVILLMNNELKVHSKRERQLDPTTTTIT